MAYLSPIPRRRDRKGAGTARILALLGRTVEAEIVRRRMVKAEQAKAALKAEETAYERAQDARKEARDEERLDIARAGESRASEEYQYEVSRRPQEEMDEESTRLWEEEKRAQQRGDWKAVAELRRQRMALNDQALAKGRAEAARGYKPASSEDGPPTDREKWIDAFSGNYGNLPAGLDVRIKQRLEGLEAYDVPEALAKMFSGKEGEDVNDTFRHPIPNSVLADPDVQSAMWDYVARNRDLFGIKGNPEPEKKRWFQFWKKGGEAKEDPFAGYEAEPTPTTGGGTYEDEIDALLGE